MNHNIYGLGYNDDEDEDDDENVTNVIEIDSNSLLVKNRPFKGFKINEEGDINQEEIINEDDENPHLHLHLLTHPQQQAMHIRCTDQVCSSCANDVPKSSTEIQLQTKRHSVSDMDDSPSLREDMETSECKIHGHVGIMSTKTYTTQNKCFVHGSNERGIYFACYGISLQYIEMINVYVSYCNAYYCAFTDQVHLGEEGNNYPATSTFLPDPTLTPGDTDNHLHSTTFFSSRVNLFKFKLFFTFK